MSTARVIAMTTGTSSRSDVGEEVFARKLAFALYLVFIVSWFLHLPERIPVLGPWRADLTLIVIIAGLVTVSPTYGRQLDSRTNRLILLLIFYVLATVPFVEWPGSVVRWGLPKLVKALIFYYFTARLVTTERRLRQLLFVFVLCQSFRVLEPLYLHVTTGYWGSAASMLGGESLDRLSGAPSDVVNPNGLAFVILTVIPFVHYLWTKAPVGRFAYIALLPLLLYALILTGSRSGLVGLAATFGGIWVQSRHKLLLAAAATVAVIAIVPGLPPDLLDRYQSIWNSDTKNAASAEGRIEGAKADLAVAMRRPLLGYGLGTSLEANANFRQRAQPSHDLFVETFQELGLVGLCIFLLLLASIVRSVRDVLRRYRTVPSASDTLIRISQAVGVWFVTRLLFSFFTYGLTDYSWYSMAGLAAALGGLTGNEVSVGRRGRAGVWGLAPR